MDLSKFSITGEAERANTLWLQNERLIRLRWMYFSTLIFIAAAANYIAHYSVLGHRYLVIGAIGLALNGLLYLSNKAFGRRRRVLSVLMVLQLVLDLGVATAATYLQHGEQARTTALYCLPIVSAALIFEPAIVYATAISSGLGYVAAIIGYMSTHYLPFSLSQFLVPLVFYPTFFLIFAQLVVYLMRVTTEKTRDQAYEAFLALLAHQLKHPASTVNAIIDYMEHTPFKTVEEQKTYITMLKAENHNLLLQLNNLLTTAGDLPPASKASTIDLPKFLQQITYQVAEDQLRVEDVKLHLHDLSFTIMGDSERLRTVLANVLNNAFQYSKAGSPVSISLRVTTDHAIITIDDKGSGMSRNAKHRMFQKYSIHQSTEGAVQGLGLGLFVSKKIVTAYGGSLHIVTDKAGTKVIIMLKRGNHEQAHTTD